MERENREIFICDCYSLDHQFAIWYDEDNNEVNLQPHLVDSNLWYQRLIFGIRYIFGYKSRYGAWDAIVINNKDIPRIQRYFDEVIIEDLRRKGLLTE